MISQQRSLVRMPDVVGMPLAKAKLILTNAGLSLDGVVFQESYEDRDTVLTQKPARGQMIYTGEKVLLGVSRESYIKWLPSIYQRQDLNGRNFVRDLLWIVQHLFGSVDETLDNVHQYFDPYEAPEQFLPWLASWSALVLDEDWPLTKKRRLIRKAIELYRTRGTVKGLKLFLGMFTGNEPIIRENEWPFRGWRIGVTSGIGVDTVVLPPVNLSHAFIIEMPVSYKDVSTETMVRIHEIIQMEKPANCQYYLRFAVDEGPAPLQEFFAIGARGIGVGVAEEDVITSEEDLVKALAKEKEKASQPAAPPVASASDRTMALPAVGAATEAPPVDDGFVSKPRSKPPLKKAPRADLAPVEGQEGADMRRTMMAQAVDPNAHTAELSARRTIAAQPVPAPRRTEEPPRPRERDRDDPMGPRGRATEDAKTKLGVDRTMLDPDPKKKK